MVTIGGVPTEKTMKRDPWQVRRMEWIAFSAALTAEAYYELLAEFETRQGAHPLADAKSPIDWRQGKPLF